MTVSTFARTLDVHGADTLGVAVSTTDGALVLAHDVTELVDQLAPSLLADLAQVSFGAKAGSLQRLPVSGHDTLKSIIVVGVGETGTVTRTTLRKAAFKAVQAAGKVTHLALAFGDTDLDAVIDGARYGAYQFTTFTPPSVRDVPDTVSALTNAKDAATIASRQNTINDAVALARDLVNTPPQAKRPPVFAELARAAVEGLPVTVNIFDETKLAADGFGGILGVGQGSSAPPRLVELRYTPKTPTDHVVLVGKGITFDTGGISLKPSASMETMKCDMAGAATMLAVITAAARLELNTELTVLLAVAENMPSGTATRVSDVLTMFDGTTVEVTNTDAEGRLVLGDALAYAATLTPTPSVVIDAATLTGAAVIALGDKISAAIGNDDALIDELRAAASVAGEPLWPMPLANDEYGERLKGSISTLKNAGGREAGPIFAALFLSRFVAKDARWVHLDIAGPAFTTSGYDIYTTGATGNPVRTLITWLTNR